MFHEVSEDPNAKKSPLVESNALPHSVPEFALDAEQSSTVISVTIGISGTSVLSTPSTVIMDCPDSALETIIVLPVSASVKDHLCHREPTSHGCLTLPYDSVSPVSLGLTRSLKYSRCDEAGNAICVCSQFLAAAVWSVSNADFSASIISFVGPIEACKKNRAAALSPGSVDSCAYVSKKN